MRGNPTGKNKMTVQHPGIGKQRASVKAAAQIEQAALIVSDIGFESIDPETLEPPSWLEARLVPEFRRLARNIAKANVLIAAHADVIASAVTDMEDAKTLRETLRKSGFTYGLSNGVPRLRPECKLLNDCTKRINIALMDFGLTPYAYSRNIAKAEQAGRIKRKPAAGGGSGGAETPADPKSKFSKFRR